MIKIGSRSSPLALAQAEQVRQMLEYNHPDLRHKTEIITFTTSGDRFVGPLRDVGGKGLFTKELEEALLDKRIDIAVHSVKDMATCLPHGLILAAVLKRGDARDVLISSSGHTLSTLPQGATIGTASLRRQALVQHYRPDLQIQLLRGNVQTRLQKLENGELDATLLALAGLQRLQLEDKISQILSVESFTPAVGQGAIGIECCEDNTHIQDIIAPLNDANTYRCIKAERAFLKVLDGSCRTPIGGYAQIDGNQLHLQGFLGTAQGLIKDQGHGDVQHAVDIGDELGHRIATALVRTQR
jgi:hydroxymethylbilane synthase